MRSGAVRIALIYVVIALVWITLSDRALYIFHHTLTPEAYLAISSAKGYFFVAVTALFLYKLIRADEKKLTETSQQATRYDDEVKRLGNIITKVNNIIIVTDKNNKISWVNKAFEDFTGYILAEITGYAPATFFAGGETDMDILSMVIRRKKAMESFSAEVKCHKKQGDTFWVNGEYTPIFNNKNEFSGYIAVYNDITNLKEKEFETGRQNNKLREVAWLCSHEVRRPLANIIGLSNLMKTTPFMEDKIRIIESIDQSAEQLDKIVRNMNAAIGIETEPVN